MIITVSSTAALISALKAAQAGDTVQLAPGVYAPVVIRGMNFAQDVTVTSVDPANAATLKGLSVTSSSGLTFQNLEFVVDPGSVGSPYKVTASQDIHFKNLYVHGSLDGNPQDDGGAFVIRTSTDVSVEDSEFEQLALAINHLDNNHLLISNNQFHDLMMDGVRGGGSSWVTISGNHFSDFYRLDGVHPDAIQFWTSNTTTTTHDIVVKDNVFERGDGGPVQGIFFGNEAKIPYENITITGNAIIGGMYNGISVAFGNKVVISDNLVLGYTDMASKIRVDDSRNVTISDNTTSHFVLQRNGEGIVQTGNTITSSLPIGDTKVLADWEVEHAATSSLDSTLQAPTSSLTVLTAETATVVVGSAVADQLVGTSAANIIDGRAGSDTMSGGAGDDTYLVDNRDVIVEAAGGGVDLVRATATTYTLAANVENLDLVAGSKQKGVGNDLDNVITSNKVQSTLIGGGGDDLLVVRGGLATMTGGAGADTFQFTALPSARADITDFVKGQDVLDLSPILSAYNGANPVGDGWVRFQSGTDGVTVLVDVDGAKGAAGFVELVKLTGVTGTLGTQDWVF